MQPFPSTANAIKYNSGREPRRRRAPCRRQKRAATAQCRPQRTKSRRALNKAGLRTANHHNPGFSSARSLTHCVNSVCQRLGKHRRGRSKTVGPGNQNPLRNRHVLRKGAGAMHAKYLPPGAEVGVAPQAGRTLAAMNQSVRNHAAGRAIPVPPRPVPLQPGRKTHVP